MKFMLLLLWKVFCFNLLLLNALSPRLGQENTVIMFGGQLEISPPKDASLS